MTELDGVAIDFVALEVVVAVSIRQCFSLILELKFGVWGDGLPSSFNEFPLPVQFCHFIDCSHLARNALN